MRKLISTVLKGVWQSLALGSVLLAFTAWCSYHSFLNLAGVTAVDGEPRFLSPGLRTSFWPELYLAEGILLAAGAVFATYFVVKVACEEVRVVRSNLLWEKERRLEQERIEFERMASDPFNRTVGYEGT